MLIDRDRELLLGFFLADDVLIEEGPNFPGLGQWRSRGYRLSLLVVGDDLVADIDALIADVDSRAGNELLHFVLRLTTERAAQRVVSSSYHSLGNSVLDCKSLREQTRLVGIAPQRATRGAR